jgi:hypothetical protein
VYATAFAPFKNDINVIHNLDMSTALVGTGGDRRRSSRRS